MATKKELVEKLFQKLNSTPSRNFYNSENDTISKDGLLEISHEVTNYLNKNSKKPEVYKQICDQLQIPPDSEHIGTAGQISAKFIEDVIKFLPEDK